MPTIEKGPDSPTCTATGFRYVLIVIDYFSRFVWVTDCKTADQEHVHYFWINVLAPIFGYPQCVYNDNGSHFTGSEMTALFENNRRYQMISSLHDSGSQKSGCRCLKPTFPKLFEHHWVFPFYLGPQNYPKTIFYRLFCFFSKPYHFRNVFVMV